MRHRTVIRVVSAIISLPQAALSLVLILEGHNVITFQYYHSAVQCNLRSRTPNETDNIYVKESLEILKGYPLAALQIRAHRVMRVRVLAFRCIMKHHPSCLLCPHSTAPNQAKILW